MSPKMASILSKLDPAEQLKRQEQQRRAQVKKRREGKRLAWQLCFLWTLLTGVFGTLAMLQLEEAHKAVAGLLALLGVVVGFVLTHCGVNSMEVES